MVHAEKEASTKSTVQPRACRYASAHIWFLCTSQHRGYMSGVVGLASNISISARFISPVSRLPNNYLVAFAHGVFQFGSVHSCHRSTCVCDQTRLLKNSSADGHTPSSGTKHVRKKFLRQWNTIAGRFGPGS